MLRNGQGVANARLIAAAPDLLEALKGVIDWWDKVNKCIDELSDAEIESIETKARATIAKAEGREV